MTEKTHTAVLYESMTASVISDIFTFLVTAGLMLLADGRSLTWQIITTAMFIFWVTARSGMLGKVHKFCSKRELVEWASSLPDENNCQAPKESQDK
jgi:hypothetical protein